MKRSSPLIRPALIGALVFVLLAVSTGLAQQTAQPAASQTAPQAAPQEPPQDQPFFKPKTADKGINKPQKFEKEGINVDFSVQPVDSDKSKDGRLLAGSNAQVTFRVTDAHTGQPVTGLRPSAWVSARAYDHTPNEAECKDKIGSYLGGFLSVRPEINLNAYYLVTLNHDNTITFINPQISFMTKLESIITLPGTGADWVLSREKNFLYVTIPRQSSVVVVNTLTRKVVATLPIGEKAKPMRIALQPDGRYVWVGLDDSANVAAIDTTTNRVAALVPAGQGLHNLAFTEDSHYVYVTNSADNTVSAIDAEKLAKVTDIKVAQTPVSIAYSSASRLVYAAGINGAAVSVIDPKKQQAIASIPVKRGVVALRFEPEGRYGFAVNQVESVVSIIDAATNTVLVTTDAVKGADQVIFTRRYAYIRGTESEKFSLLDLDEVKKGKLAPAVVQAGQKPPSASPEDIGVADMMAPAPEGNSVLIASAPDQVIYYYTEGLMAASGTIDNYKRRPRALMLIDNSLSEIAPGTYTVAVKMRRGGRFDVPMLIDQPRISNCFQLEVADTPGADRQKGVTPIASVALFKDQQFKLSEPARLKFKIVDSITKEPVAGLSDVHVLIFEPPGVWQQRQFAKEVEKGVYEVTQTFPETGIYRVMVQVESKGVRYVDLPYTEIGVLENVKPETSPSTANSQGAIKRD